MAKKKASKKTTTDRSKTGKGPAKKKVTKVAKKARARGKSEAKKSKPDQKVIREFVPDQVVQNDGRSFTSNLSRELLETKVDPALIEARDQLEALLRLGPTHKRRGSEPGSQIEGVGICLKRVGSVFTGDVAIKVYVPKKLAKSKIAPDSLVPTFINGIPTDVEEIGDVKALAAGFKGRYPRPVPCGSSCAHFAVGAGTLGALVGLDDGSLAMLSNNHVLGNVNRARPDEKILQPSRNDRGTLGDFVGVWAKSVPISFSSSNLVDAAVAYTKYSLASPSHITYRLDPHPLAPEKRMSVIKNGRATGATEGIITGVGINGINVNYGSRQARFDNQIEIRSISSGRFCAEGDSGSLIVTADSPHRPVGLLFAADGLRCYANPIGPVMELLGISFFVNPI